MTTHLLARHGWPLLCLALLACGGDSGTNPATSDGDGGSADGGLEGDAGAEDASPAELDAPAGELALRVDKARQVVKAGSSSYLEVQFTLANGIGAAPASLNAALLQVKTKAGLYVSASPGTLSWLDSPTCDPALSVGDGASYTCALTFDVDASDGNIVELYYRTANEVAGVGDDRRSARAPLTLDPCAQCGDDCTYLDRDVDHCGECGQNVRQVRVDYGNYAAGLCEKGRPVCPDGYPTFCEQPLPDGSFESACTDTNTSTFHCGACNTPVLHGRCEDGEAVCDEGPTTTSCGNQYCLDLTSSDAHCGACDKACDDRGSCEELYEKPGTYACVSQGTGFIFEEEPESWSRPLPSLDWTCEDACKSLGYDGCNSSTGSCTDGPDYYSSGERFLSCSCYANPK